MKKQEIPSKRANRTATQLEQACVALRQAGLKWTPNREALLTFLIENHGPFSMEEIQKALPESDVDSVTLYRNLAHLEKIRLIRRSEFGDRISRYEFQETPDDHHHHVKCTECGDVKSLESCALPKLELIVKKLGYSNIRHSLEFFGECRTCTSRA